MAWFSKIPKLKKPNVRVPKIEVLKRLKGVGSAVNPKKLIPDAEQVKNTLKFLDSLKDWPSARVKDAMEILKSTKNIPTDARKRALEIIKSANVPGKSQQARNALKILYDARVKPTAEQVRNAMKVKSLAIRDWSFERIEQLEGAVKRKYHEWETANRVYRILERDWRNFIVIYKFADELRKVADAAASGASSINEINKARKYLKELKWFESKERMFAFIRGLHDALIELMPYIFPRLTPEERDRTVKASRDMSIAEATVLFDTVKRLEPEIAEKEPLLVNWQKVKEICEEIVKYSLKIVSMDEDLRNRLKRLGYKPA